MKSQTGINVRVFRALLQGRREVLTATSTNHLCCDPPPLGRAFMNARQRFGQQRIEVRAQDVSQHRLPQAT